MEIRTFSFDLAGKAEQERLERGVNWPVVYFLYNANTLYIGESTSAAQRMGDHLNDPRKRRAHLTNMKVIFDDEFNKSVILDYEQKLIKYCKADDRFTTVLNANDGQSDAHDYYQRPYYAQHFHYIWQELINQGMANKELDVIENENIFKYSPYTALTPEQMEVQVRILNDIVDVLDNNRHGVSLVNGCAGTGKTVLAISIINSLVNAINIDESTLSQEDKEKSINKARLRVKWYVQHVRPIRIGFVFPMSGIRSVISDVFREAGNGLRRNMVITPYKVTNQEYDILFVDESHRLARRKNLGQPSLYNLFDRNCEMFGLDPQTSNQLDWILRSSKYSVLFYDKDQSIKSTDITYNDYQNSLEPYRSELKELELKTQMRCAGGNAYIDYVKDIMNCRNPDFKDAVNYDFKIYRNVDNMVQKIRELDYAFIEADNDNNLCKVVAGYSWDWATKPAENNVPDDLNTYNEIVESGAYDIEMQGYHYIWNLTTEKWIPRHDSHYTIGCIHTTQGFDLNYVGVIFGKEIDYNPETNEIEIDLTKFKDTKVKSGCDEATVKEYIINTYTTILARGVRGCYVCAYNHNMQEYLERFIRRGD